MFDLLLPGFKTENVILSRICQLIRMYVPSKGLLLKSYYIHIE